MMNKQNKYDYYLIALIASLGAGEFGGALQLPRAIAILLIPALLKAAATTPKHIIKKPRTFAVVILAWSFISLAWTGSFERGLEELVYFIVHMLYFLEIVVFTSKSNKQIRSISTGWCIAVLATAAVAFWEIQTGQHLITSKMQEDKVLSTGFVRRFASATFYNFNDYEVFLCYSVPFLLVAISTMKKWKETTLFFLALLCAVVVCIFNASRGATIAILTMTVLGLLGIINKSSTSRKYIFVLVSLFTFILYKYADAIFMNLAARLEISTMAESGRTEIWYLALLCLENTMFIGTGIAGVEKGMSVVSNDYLAPHNLFLEILVEFGIFIFTFIAGILLKMLRHTAKGKSPYKRIIIATFIAWPIIAIVSSKYLLCPDLYAFIASFYVLIYHEKYTQTIHRPLW